MAKLSHAPAWNLKVYFKDNLHDCPEDRDQMNNFIAEETREIELLKDNEKFNRISHLAVYHRLLGNYSRAHELFQKAFDYFEKTDLKMSMVNLIRWADVFRFEKKFDESKMILKKAEGLISENIFLDYQDFYWQHLGKLHFDKSEYKTALSCFENALKLRNSKKNLELISSSEFAIKMTKQKMNT